MLGHGHRNRRDCCRSFCNVGAGGRNSFIRVNSIANPHPPKISKILIGASRCPRTWCVAVPDGATELERLRDRNQGIAPPSNADLIAIIRAKDDLICQLKTPALETACFIPPGGAADIVDDGGAD